MKQDRIFEFSDLPFNSVTGCTKISPGCRYCYAEEISNKLSKWGKAQAKYKNGFKLTVHPDEIQKFYTKAKGMRKRRLVFVDSMSDLFHEDVPLEHIEAVFEMVNGLSKQLFICLTKRSKRLMELSENLKWPFNLIMGVSVENADYIYRIDHLRECAAQFRCVSIEPFLGPIPDVNLSNVDWVICGGESGINARPMKEEWVLELRDQCVQQNVPFLFKQWGGQKRRERRNLLDGKIWIQFPRRFFGAFTPDIAEEDKKWL